MADIMQQYQAILKGPFILPENLPDPGTLPDNGPRVLLIAPHPDDECITGALALRLRLRSHAQVRALAVTLGSRMDRRDARKAEFEAACSTLGFQPAIAPSPGSFCIQNSITSFRPHWILYPHANDAHPTHGAVHHSVVEALRHVDFSIPHRVETEYWHPHRQPNFLVESPPEEVALLLKALCCHKGEIARNPYHRTLPAWMIDNARRASERIRPFGSSAPTPRFATCYHYRFFL